MSILLALLRVLSAHDSGITSLTAFDKATSVFRQGIAGLVESNHFKQVCVLQPSGKNGRRSDPIRSLTGLDAY